MSRSTYAPPPKIDETFDDDSLLYSDFIFNRIVHFDLNNTRRPKPNQFMT